jgi:ribosomal 50S subunit-recycling heat shock protein
VSLGGGEGDEEACRLDVWLFRARLFKTRSLAARFVADGRVRLTRDGVEARVEKAARLVRPDDVLVFARGGRVMVLKISALGARRGPSAEAKALYVHFDQAPAAPGGDQGPWR